MEAVEKSSGSNIATRNGINLTNRALEKKLNVIQKYEAGFEIGDIIRQLDIKRSIVKDIARKKHKIKSDTRRKTNSSGRRKVTINIEYKELDLVLYQWFVEQKVKNVLVDRQKLHQQAIKLSSDFGCAKFSETASNWLFGFRKRHNIICDKNGIYLSDGILISTKDEDMSTENGNGIEFLDEEKEPSNFEDKLLQNHKKRKLQDVIDDSDEIFDEMNDEIFSDASDDISSYLKCDCSKEIRNLTSDVTLLKNEVVRMSGRQRIYQNKIMNRLQLLDNLMNTLLKYKLSDKHVGKSQNEHQSESPKVIVTSASNDETISNDVMLRTLYPEVICSEKNDSCSSSEKNSDRTQSSDANANLSQLPKSLNDELLLHSHKLFGDFDRNLNHSQEHKIDPNLTTASLEEYIENIPKIIKPDLKNNEILERLYLAQTAKDWRKTCRKLIDLFNLDDELLQGENRKLMVDCMVNFIRNFKYEDISHGEVRYLVRQKYKEMSKKSKKQQEIQGMYAAEQELEVVNQIALMEEEMEARSDNE